MKSGKKKGVSARITRTLALLTAVGMLAVSVPAAENEGAASAPAAAQSTASEAAASGQESAAAVTYAMDHKSNPNPFAENNVVQTNAYEGWPKGREINADFACLLDANTGAVLYGKSKDTATPPASITKIMTCLLALEHGNLDDQVTMTETGVAFAVDGSSNLYTQVGEVFTLRDMLYGMMLKSANDIATQVGEYIGGGSIDRFIEMMNEKAKELGCRNTHFANACGMPNDEHLTTAYDMCLITQAALQYPLFRELIGTYQYTIPATNMTEARSFTNHHHWLETPSDGVSGFVGGKTGYTDAALNTLVSVAERDGMTLIAVTMHANGSELCLEDTGYLFRYGFKFFKNKVMDDAQDLERKGIVSIPNDADESKITSTTTEQKMSGYGDVLFTQYMFGEKKIGSSILTKAAQEAREKAAAESAAAASRAEALAAASSAAAESVVEEAYEILTPAPTRTAERVVLPLGITMDRTLFLVIAALSGMILLGVISIIITMIVRRR